MKKVLNLIQWASFWSTIVVIFMIALFAGAEVCLWIEDALNITGWWCMLMIVPDMAIIFAILLFFAQGMKVIDKEK